MDKESLNEPLRDPTEQFLAHVKTNYAQRTPSSVIQEIINRTFQGESLRSISADRDVEASRTVVEKIRNFLRDNKYNSWQDVDVPTPEKTITQKVRGQHLERMNEVLERDWSLQYFRELGIDTSGDLGQKALNILVVYEQEKHKPGLTKLYLDAVFWVYLHTLGLKPSLLDEHVGVFESMIHRFDADLDLHKDEFPHDALSVWGIIKFEAWKGGANADAWHAAYDEIKIGNRTLKRIRHKEDFRKSLEIEKEILGGIDE